MRNNYIENADRTSAPVEPVMHRLAEKPQSLHTLFYILTAIRVFAAALDKWKAWAYYGKGDAPLVPQLCDLPREVPIDLMEKALSTIEDMHFLEIMHAAIGIGSEAGEMIESLIPALFEQKALDVPNVHEESGDLLWYLAKLFKYTNTDFDKIMAANIAKLRARYPKKFTEADAANRNLDAEKSAMAGERDSQAIIAHAISDPGAFTPRGDNFQESIPAWGARAVMIALDIPEGSKF